MGEIEVVKKQRKINIRNVSKTKIKCKKNKENTSNSPDFKV
jgi:hypothetical protein